MKIVYYNQKKQKRAWVKTVIFFLSVFAASWSFFWLPYFKISKLEINDPLVNKREVEEKLSLSLSSLTQLFLPKSNFFLFPSKSVEEAILESGLGVAKVEKRFPNKVFVEFEEIKPKFLHCKEENCFYVDKNGILYETAPFFSDSPIPTLEIEKKIRIGEELISKTETEFLIEFGKEIQSSGFSMQKIKIDKDLEIFTSEGWKLIFIFGKKNPKDLAHNLLLLFERKIKDRTKLEYIDMRFPNKAYYKLK